LWICHEENINPFPCHDNEQGFTGGLDFTFETFERGRTKGFVAIMEAARPPE